MGLFSKRVEEPIDHPPVERVVYVRAGDSAVTRHLDEYSSLFCLKRSEGHDLQVATSGEWTAIRLPDVAHPWQLHNLAYWMLDCEYPGRVDECSADVIAVSKAAPNHHGYWLVRDDEVPDALCGWDDAGDGWTVHAPGNDIVRPEAVPISRGCTIPTGFHDWRPVAVRLEDPGTDMNPRNESTVTSRKDLRERHHLFVMY